MQAQSRRQTAGGKPVTAMHRYKFVLYRPLQFLPVLFGISIITFVLVRLIPGDPARVLLGTRATPEAIARIRAQYGLDEPMLVQYLYFLHNLADGEMGRSILYKIDVLKLIAHTHRADADAGPVQRRAVGADRRAARGDRGPQPGPVRRPGDPHHLDLRHRLSALLAGADADHPVQREARHLPGVGLRRHGRATSWRISSCPASPSRCRCRRC